MRAAHLKKKEILSFMLRGLALDYSYNMYTLLMNFIMLIGGRATGFHLWVCSSLCATYILIISGKFFIRGNSLVHILCSYLLLADLALRPLRFLWMSFGVHAGPSSVATFLSTRSPGRRGVGQDSSAPVCAACTA